MSTSYAASPQLWQPPHPPVTAAEKPSLMRRLFPPWLLVFGTGLTLYFILYAALLATHNFLYVPSLILLGAFTVPVAFLVYVSRAAGGTAVPAWVLGMCALWGGVLGTVIAGTIETDALRILGVVPALLIGITEETAKLIVPVLLFLTVARYRRREVDGIVIGVAVGMGFAVLETMGYGFAALLGSRGNLHAVDQLLLVRGLLAPAGHVAWTGLASAALWRAGIRGTPRAVLGFIGTVALVILLHTAWDGLATWWAYLLIAVVGLGLLHLRLHRIRVAERRRVA